MGTNYMWPLRPSPPGVYHELLALTKNTGEDKPIISTERTFFGLNLINQISEY